MYSSFTIDHLGEGGGGGGGTSANARGIFELERTRRENIRFGEVKAFE